MSYFASYSSKGNFAFKKSRNGKLWPDPDTDSYDRKELWIWISIKKNLSRPGTLDGNTEPGENVF
jgi:hypothetical protein